MEFEELKSEEVCDVTSRQNSSDRLFQLEVSYVVNVSEARVVSLLQLPNISENL